MLSLDLAAMVAGTKYRGEFEERMKKMMKEVQENDDIILFIDELHTIIGAGGPEGTMDASNIMKPALSRGEIQIIGATTTKEYTRHIEKDLALERRFQVVKVSERHLRRCSYPCHCPLEPPLYSGESAPRQGNRHSGRGRSR